MTSTFSSAEQAHYEFGKNWEDFIEKHFDPSRAEISRQNLLTLLHLPSLEGKTFLDIGSGSGLHSLAAWMSGAEHVTSFDYDPDSVATTRRLHALAGSPENWIIRQGDILSEDFLATLQTYDIVYSWGVLHHTGAMWQAIRNASRFVKPDGVFAIALYTSDVYVRPSAEKWLYIKRSYNAAGPLKRFLMECWHLLRYVVLPDLRHRKNPWRTIREYRQLRGMSLWTDIRDWLGGWPMEFAGILETRRFFREELGMHLVWQTAGEGNTEYVFAGPQATSLYSDPPIPLEIHPLRPPFLRQGERTFVTQVPELQAESDPAPGEKSSPWVLFEDNEPQTLPHALPSHIEAYGAGRYCHTGEKLFFATLDGSDPNSHGHRYSLRKRPAFTILPAIRSLPMQK